VLLYTLPVQWRLGKDLLVWIYVLGILPAMSGTFTSYTRFESTAFPVFIALAAFLNAEGGVRTAESSVTPVAPRLATLASRLPRLRVAVRWALLGTFAVLHLWLLWRFVNFRWAG
jgi:NhaP-type Na+/H+ and K+/H+ antiporter